ncbi:progestin and adipoQ receptor family member 4 [Engraulis encrasicolus]|uniref:progestin and adipoQ receptor family member 4 n=1 Tax=Engraulis encrasicolus TaxID=184585 RepID=UPI002FD6CF2E
MAFVKKPKLIEYHTIPPHLQFNDFVHTGYRPVSTFKGCVDSLFYLHNEFGNIYTHAIPFVCFALLLPLNIPWWQAGAGWICVLHYLACLSPTVGSVLYHTFMNHEGGEFIYDTLLSLDMFGVCLVNTLGALPIVHITLLCYPDARNAALLAYISLSVYGVYCAVTARTNVRRLQSFFWQAVFRLVLYMLRWYGPGTGNPASMPFYAIMDSLAVLGGLVNVARMPERMSPGSFDYWLNSHQIMHVLVALSIVYLHWGMMEDLVWLETFECPPE